MRHWAIAAISAGSSTGAVSRVLVADWMPGFMPSIAWASLPLFPCRKADGSFCAGPAGPAGCRAGRLAAIQRRLMSRCDELAEGVRAALDPHQVRVLQAAVVVQRDLAHRALVLERQPNGLLAGLCGGDGIVEHLGAEVLPI